MPNLVAIWCRAVPPGEVFAWAAPHLVRAGFEGGILADRPAGDPCGWELLKIGGRKAFLGCSSRTEDCSVLEVSSKAPGTDVRASFLSLWRGLLGDHRPWVVEVILQEGTMDVYPLLAHSSTRRTPLGLAIVEGAGAARVVEPRDASYWAELGPRLHFVSDELLREYVATSPEVFAASMGATHSLTPAGIVLDCGWAAGRLASPLDTVGR